MAERDRDENQISLDELHITDSHGSDGDQVLNNTTANNQSQNLTHGRSQLADINSLRTLIDIVESNLTDSLETCTDALRCIGNACIDNDRVRDWLSTLGFNWALRCLSVGDDDLQTLTVKVLYNACADHEGAQKACLNYRVHLDLIHFLASKARISPEVDEWAGNLWELTAELIFDICGHVKDIDVQDTLSEHTIGDLLWLPTVDFQRPEYQSLDSYASLIETTQVFLRSVHNQKRVVEMRLFDDVWRVYLSIEYKLELASNQDPSMPDEQDLAARNQLLIPLSASFTWILSDIAATEGFAQNYPVQDGFIEGLISLLVNNNADEAAGIGQRAAINERITNAACQIVGNVLWASPAQDCLLLVEKSGQQDTDEVSTSAGRPLPESLLNILITAQGGELLHSAIGLLIQLTRPNPVVRNFLGRNARTALERICKHQRPEIRQGAIKLLRALAKDCPSNQERFHSLAEETLQSLPQPADGT